MIFIVYIAKCKYIEAFQDYLLSTNLVQKEHNSDKVTSFIYTQES